mmetsp:Transcript_385/g.359  ORF Transcript_385/g.359 Transcript_385/m.359 type:complete len:86 (+) Transcript_385:209-466(+)
MPYYGKKCDEQDMSHGQTQGRPKEGTKESFVRGSSTLFLKFAQQCIKMNPRHDLGICHLRNLFINGADSGFILCILRILMLFDEL